MVDLKYETWESLAKKIASHIVELGGIEKASADNPAFKITDDRLYQVICNEFASNAVSVDRIVTELGFSKDDDLARKRIEQKLQQMISSSNKLRFQSFSGQKYIEQGVRPTLPTDTPVKTKKANE